MRRIAQALRLHLLSEQPREGEAPVRLPVFGRDENGVAGKAVAVALELALADIPGLEKPLWNGIVVDRDEELRWPGIREGDARKEPGAGRARRDQEQGLAKTRP